VKNNCYLADFKEKFQQSSIKKQSYVKKLMLSDFGVLKKG